MNLARELKKPCKIKVTVIPLVNGAPRTVSKVLERDSTNYSIFETGQNTGKRPEELRRLAVTWTPIKDYQLKLARKTQKE